MMVTSYDVDLRKIDASSPKDSINRLTNVSVSLQSVIDAYESETLNDLSDPTLEAARNVLEAAITQLSFDTESTSVIGTLKTIYHEVFHLLTIRYGCND